MKESTEIQDVMSNILTNIENRTEQVGDNSDFDDVDGTPTDNVSDHVNLPVPINDSEVQFNMNGSLISKEFFQKSIEKKLSKSALNIYIFLGFNCDVKTGLITRDITIDVISAACNICNRMVSYAFSELQDKNFINRTGDSLIKCTLLYKK